MDVDAILTPHAGTQFLDGEIGEVDCRVVATPMGPRVAVVAYAAKVLTRDERVMLAGLRDVLVSSLERTHYKTTKKPDGGIE